jgi:hypothetical protein
MYGHLRRSFYLLKLQWWRMPEDKLWTHLRSIVTREHLHTTGYFERNFKSQRVINCAALLRMRRLQIISHLENRGFVLNRSAKSRTSICL